MQQDFLAEMMASSANDAPSNDIDLNDNPLSGDTLDTDILDKSQDADGVIDKDKTSEEEWELKPYISLLKETGLLDIPQDMEDLNGTPEELEKIINYTKETRFAAAAEAIHNSLPDDFKPLLEYALAGGKSLQEYLDTFSEDFVDTITLETEANQKRVLQEYYKRTTKHSDEKISRLVSLISDPEDLKVAAEEALEDLKELRQQSKASLIEQAKAKADATRKEIEAQTVALATAIDKTSLIHAQRKNKVKSFFFEPVVLNNQTTTLFNSTIQTILKNPEHQAQLGDLLLDYDPNTGFSFDRYEKKSRSKVSQEFRQLLETTLDKKGARSTKQTPTTPQWDWEKYNQY